MPMDFPDLISLKHAAKVHGFRDFNPNEDTEKSYRMALASYIRKIDIIESFEIQFF